MNLTSERDEIADVQARLNAMPPEEQAAMKAKMRESWAEVDRKAELRRQLPAAKDKLTQVEARSDDVADRWSRATLAAEEYARAVSALDHAKTVLREAVTRVDVSLRDLDKIAARADAELKAAAAEVDEARGAVAKLEAELS